MQIGEQTNKKLDLVKINSAQKQVVAGLNYVLVVETAAESEKETYEAHVYGEPNKLSVHVAACIHLLRLSLSAQLGESTAVGSVLQSSAAAVAALKCMHDVIASCHV